MQPPPFAPLRVLSFGAGAIGTYIGGSLAAAGHAVTFLERPEVVPVLRQQGLRLSGLGGSGDRQVTIEAPRLAGSLAEALALGPYDVGLYALKSFDTPAAIETMQPYREALPPLLCLSNGVENEPALAAALGSHKVLAGTVTSAIGRAGAGQIVLERLRGMGVARGQPVAEAAAAACSAAELKARLFPAAAGMKWSKLLTNLLSNATSAILDLPPAQVFAHPGLFRLEVRQLRETLAVMAAQDVPVVDLPGVPVKLLAFGLRYLPLPALRPLLQRAVGGGRGGKMPSFYIDLHNGRGQSEVDYLNGAVARFGQKLGVPAPANSFLNDTLLALTRGDLPLDTYAHQPEKLLAAFEDRL